MKKIIINLSNIRKKLVSKRIYIVLFTIIILFTIDLSCYLLKYTHEPPSIIGSILAGSVGGFLIHFVSSKKTENLKNLEKK